MKLSHRQHNFELALILHWQLLELQRGPKYNEAISISYGTPRGTVDQEAAENAPARWHPIEPDVCCMQALNVGKFGTYNSDFACCRGCPNHTPRLSQGVSDHCCSTMMVKMRGEKQLQMPKEMAVAERKMQCFYDAGQLRAVGRSGRRFWLPSSDLLWLTGLELGAVHPASIDQKSTQYSQDY